MEITNVDEYKTFKRTNEKGIIFYHAKNCPACKDIEGLYFRIGKKYSQYVTLAHADVDTCGLGFKVVPVFVVFHKDQAIHRVEGIDKSGLKELVKNLIKLK